MANILEDVQNYVVGKLSGDYILSACPFLAENRKDIDYEIKNKLGKQGIVGLVMTPKATYAGKFEDLFLSWTLEELEIDIVENVTVNRGKRNGYVTGQDAAMRLFDVLCPLSGDFEGQFNPVSYEEGEDGNLIVNKCVLKALIYGEHGDVPQPEKPITYQFVKLLDQPPPLSVQPHDGWMWQDADGLYFYVDHVAHKLGDVSSEQLSAYVESQMSSKVEISAFNELQNSLSDYYTKSETSSAVELSALEQKLSTYTDSQVSSKADKSELSNFWSKDDTLISTEIGFEVGNFNSLSADYNDGILLGEGAGVVGYESGGAVVLEQKYVTSQAHYKTAIMTPSEIQLVSKDGDEDPVVHGHLKFPRNDGQNTTLATLDDIDAAVSSKAERDELSNYYTKSETSSNVEISTALNLKQDKLTDEQIANINTKCLPLNLSSNTAISGNNYLDFHCLPRFFAPVVMNGALDVKQLNVVNYDVDSYTALSTMDEDTLGFIGGFNREHIAVLNLKNDTIAYISDISAMYEARISALEAQVVALSTMLQNQ